MNNKEHEGEARVESLTAGVDRQELPQRGQPGEVTAAKLTHTGGPWVSDRMAQAVRAVGDRMTVCDIRGWGYLTGAGGLHLADADAIAIQHANARLIAAAPDMLEAVKAIRLRLHFVGHPREPHVQGLLAPSVPDWGKEIALIEKALAKAEGQ